MNNNQTIKIYDKEFKPYYSADILDSAVTKIASNLNYDFAAKSPVFLSVLNGAFMFTSDLLKKLNIDCELSFIKMSSYQGTKSTGEVKTILGLTHNLFNRHVILLEDIVDTGNTIEELIHLIDKLNPASVKVAAMFYKPQAFKKSFKIDYVGIEISNEFIVGYGLDYNEKGRNLAEVYKIV
jgi:hypoxanthine phosphoribosyltransferase